ncbi:AAA family ATPase (plasmid) [Streptomyces sp. NBC_01343]|uniref:AAA family ATPase n=1 Tax=Streptomyces sp. NBC_01343 TaxID=2903832 RepID=UPI002E14B52C|nr:AAA family ATPase [Streptomyces sp. NBC_01343]WSI29135.1 AAA family ATPase [Streptomyces sp. NBC_01343]
MRLHTLTLQAFGPFRTRQSIDFDTLSQGGLFLLHGATGAGKSTVFDAVCYALYGNVPGERHQTALRSHHADPATLTQVELEFTMAGRRLKIVRTPNRNDPDATKTAPRRRRPQSAWRSGTVTPAPARPSGSRSPPPTRKSPARSTTCWA